MTSFLALQFTPPDISFALIAPELIICLVGVAVMLVDAFARPEQRWVTGSVSLAGLLAAAVATIWLWLSWGGEPGIQRHVGARGLVRFPLVFIESRLDVRFRWSGRDAKLSAGEFIRAHVATARLMLMRRRRFVIIFRVWKSSQRNLLDVRFSPHRCALK